MVKQIRPFLLALLCFFNGETAQAYLSDTTQLTSSFSSYISESMYKVLHEHPIFTTLLAALVSIFSVKRFFSRSPYKPIKMEQKEDPSAIAEENNQRTHNSIEYNPADKTLTVYQKQKSPITIEHVIQWSYSPKLTYVVINQFKKRIPLKKMGTASLFGDSDITDVYKFMQQYVYETLLVDISSGEITSIGSAISVEFNDQETAMISLETHELSFLYMCYNRALAQFNITKYQKFIPFTEYKVYDLQNKTVISSYKNKKNVSFFDSDTIQIIDETGKSCLHSKNGAINKKPRTTITYEFKEAHNTYSLTLKTHNKTQKTFENISSFYITPDKKFLILYQIENIGIFGGKSLLPDTKNIDFIAAIQNNATITHIVETQSGETIYSNNGILSVTPYSNQQSLYIAKQKGLTLQNVVFDPIKKSKNSFDQTHFLSFELSGTVHLLDSNNNPIHITSPTETLNQIAASVAKKVEEIGNNLNKLFTQKRDAEPNQNTEISLTNTSITRLDTTYDRYTFSGEKTATDTITKKSTKELLEKGICGFEWNIYDFTKAQFRTIFNTINDNNATICISNQSPEKMEYSDYQSLQKELSTVLKHAQLDNAKNSVFTVILNNYCPNETLIDREIVIAISKAQGKNPLFTPNDKNQNGWPTLQHMIDQQKNVAILVNNKNSQTYTTSPLTHLIHDNDPIYHNFYGKPSQKAIIN